MEGFSPIWVLEEAELTATQVLQSARLSAKKVEDLLKNSSFENDLQSLIFTLKGTYSQRHEGSSNEDAGSFDLYWVVIIGSSEMISLWLCLDCVLPLSCKYTAHLSSAEPWGEERGNKGIQPHKW